MARDYCIFLRNKKSPDMALTAQRLRAVIEFKSVCETGKGISLLLKVVKMQSLILTT